MHPVLSDYQARAVLDDRLRTAATYRRAHATAPRRHLFRGVVAGTVDRLGALPRQLRRAAPGATPCVRPGCATA